ncbi:MAG: RpoL/Rpb11 RNA polymerase subunit family protein [Nitrososphaerales archaeon]
MMPTHLSKKDDILEVKFVGEDVALADILHHELLKESGIIFAGVAPTHPLLAETTLTIRSKTDPTKILSRSIKKASETIKELLDKTEDTLKKG